MKKTRAKTAYVIGSGPNGLTAAITLARAGVRTTVLEAESTIGGGTRSAELTLPGFVHDLCSAVHPLGISSPAFAEFPLREHGLEWIQPAAPLVHPLDDGTAVVLHRSVEETAAGLGADGPAWRRSMTPLVARWNQLVPEILQPVAHIPRHPFLLARFGAVAPWPATVSARTLFRTPAARALFAGLAAHSMLPLRSLISGAFAWVLGIAGHAVGWPIPRGGSQQIANALQSYFESLGGRVVPNTRVASLNELRDADLVLCDVSPRQLLAIAGARLPAAFIRKLERYRYGPGIFKMDWALSAPIPWKASACRLSATVHVGGTLEEVAASERAPWHGKTDPRPFVLVVQPTLFDPARAPAGQHIAWAYCHVPNGSTADQSAAIEDQIERFAPGFRQCILARSKMNTAQLQHHNANLQGGDIGGGAVTVKQFLLRPTARLYGTPVRGLYLCSASTPPGGAVHGMCGYHAARRALAEF